MEATLNFFELKFFLTQLFYWLKNFFDRNWVIKILGKQFLGKKNFGQKDLDRIFFCLKKQLGLTQGGGYMTPPPENSRVKIVLDCC